MQHGRLVGIRFVEGCPSTETKLAKLSLGLCGYHGALPDLYGANVEELVAMLNRVHAQLADPPT